MRSVLVLISFLLLNSSVLFSQGKQYDYASDSTAIKVDHARALLNVLHFRASDLLQFCAGVTYERYLLTKTPMSLMFSYSYGFMQSPLFYYKPDHIFAAGFRYQFARYDNNINFYVLPELVYSERSVSIFRSYSSPAGYLSGGVQYKSDRFSAMSSFGAGLAGTLFSYSPAVRFQLNLGYAF